MSETEHVRRGLQVHRNRPPKYDLREDDAVTAIWFCEECDDRIEARQRDGRHSYVELGCSCGAVSVEIRIADLLDLDLESWDNRTPMEVGRRE